MAFLEGAVLIENLETVSSLLRKKLKNIILFSSVINKADEF